MHPKFFRFGLFFTLLFTHSGFVAGQNPVSHRQELMVQANNFYDLDSLEQALYTYRQVADVRPSDSLTAYALHRMGVCAFYSDQEPEAIAYYHRALAARQRIFPEAHNQTAKTMANLADVFIYTDQIDSAAHFLYLAADQYPKITVPDTVNWLRVLVDLAKVAEMKQDFQLVQDAASAAGNLLMARPTKLYDDEALLHHFNLATLLSGTFSTNTARHHAQVALEMSRTQGLPATESEVYNLLHIIADKQGMPEAAQSQLQKAIKLGVRADLDSVILGTYYYNLARLFVLGGNFQEAELAGHLALDLLPAGDESVVYTYTNLAQAAAMSGDQDLALSYFNQGTQTINNTTAFVRGKLTHQPSDQLTDSQLGQLSEHLVERARFLASADDLPAAKKDYLEALRARQLFRSQVSSDASRRVLSQDLRPVFDEAVTVCVRMFQQTNDHGFLWDALLLSDRARAYTLNAKLQRDRETLPAREAALQRRIGRLEALVETDKNKQNELTNARLERDRVRQRARQTATPDTASLSRKDIGDHLSTQQTVLLQYHLTDKTAYLFAVTPTGAISVYPLPGAGSLTESVQQWREDLRASAYRMKSLRAPEEQAQLDQNFWQHGHNLARTLVPEMVFEGQSPETILLVPDGPLNFLPFAALPLDAPGESLNHRTMNYFGDLAPLQNAYSLSSLFHERKPGTGNTSLLGVAPSFTGQLQPLRFNQLEVSAVAQHFSDAVCLSGPEAGRAAFLDRVGDARILHLSTHGFADAANPNRTYIAFSQSADTLDPDELLYYPEVAGLPLTADLVVLSACETSLGKYVPGETSLSLASAFTAAGARSTVTTLWRVDDLATSDLMIGFYQKLAAGEDRTVALSGAQTALREGDDFAHPYYWAGMVLTGQAGPVEMSAGLSQWWWAGALFCFGLVVLGWRRHR